MHKWVVVLILFVDHVGRVTDSVASGLVLKLSVAGVFAVVVAPIVAAYRIRVVPIAYRASSLDLRCVVDEIVAVEQVVR